MVFSISFLKKTDGQDEPCAHPCISVVNMASALKQVAGVAIRFVTWAPQFLGVSIDNIGYILREATVGRTLSG